MSQCLQCNTRDIKPIKEQTNRNVYPDFWRKDYLPQKILHVGYIYTDTSARLSS